MGDADLSKLPGVTHVVADDDPLQARLAELATLSKLEYEKQRKSASKDLNMRTTVLDELVADLQPKEEKEAAQGSAVKFSDPEPWPEPVPTATLLDELVAIITRHVVIGDHEATACALWAAMTHQTAAFDLLPLLMLSSPEKRAGKATLLGLLGRFTAKSLPISNISAAPLFRIIEEHSPTVLIDEADSFMAEREEVRSLIKAGHSRFAAGVIRCVGDNQEPRAFNVFCPKAIALICKIDPVIEDRAVLVHMKRKTATERVERLPERLRNTDTRRKLLRWAADTRPTLSDDDYLVGVNDRAADNWESLIAIARLAGPDWLNRATEAAYAISGIEEEDAGIGALLLSHIREVFEDRASLGMRDADKIHSEDLVANLVALEGEPWAEWHRGKPMKQRSLANQLKNYLIKPRDVRIGAIRRKGYRLEWFADAFDRYISSSPSPALDISATPRQSTNHAGFEPISNATAASNGADENRPEASKNAGCRGVADKNGVPAGGYKIRPDKDETGKVYEEVTGKRWRESESSAVEGEYIPASDLSNDPIMQDLAAAAAAREAQLAKGRKS